MGTGQGKPGQRSLFDAAEEAFGLLDPARPIWLVGDSLGTGVVAYLAGTHPERVSGLGLISTQVLADTPARREDRFKTAAEVAEKGTAGVVEGMTPKFTADPHLQGIARQSMERQQPAAFIGALKAMGERADSTPLLESIHFPVVLVHGDADGLIPIERAREVKENNTHTQH